MAPSIDSPASPIPSPLYFNSGKQSTITAVSEIIDEDDSNGAILQERKRLRRHLGLGDEPGDPPREPPAFQPLFFIERVPDPRGVACNLPGCTERIQPDDLRLALNPAMGSNHWFRASSDYYHIACFEKLADFTQSTYLDRIQPLTRNTWKLRGLKASTVLDGSYLVSGGVERLVQEWKVTRKMWIDKRDGVFNEDVYMLEPNIRDLLYCAGSAKYEPRGRPAVLDLYEYYTLSRVLAPNESDGVRDGEEWNLFEAYLGFGSGVHGLSGMLRRWEGDVMLAWQMGNAGDGGRELEGKRTLSAKAVRALRRLSAVPLPQVGYNRLFS